MEAILRELADFVDARLPAWRETWAGKADSWEAACAWQRTLSEGRWSAPGWPEIYGGRGLAIRECLAVEDFLNGRGAPLVPGMLGLKNVGPTLQAVGTDEQKKHLPAILNTDEIWCQGFSEPGAGSDLASLRTRAELKGDRFVVNGQKIWTSAGLKATHMQLLARTDPDAAKHNGISAMIVRMDSPGIEVRPIRQISGDSGFAEVFFTDVEVPVENLLGKLHDGWKVTMTTLAYERSGIALFAARLERRAREALHAAAASSLTPVAQDALVSRYVESRVVGMLGKELLDRLADGQKPGDEQSIIKLVWSEAGQKLEDTIADLAGDDLVFGGSGPEAKAFLMARANTIAAGTSQIMRSLLGERILGLPR